MNRIGPGAITLGVCAIIFGLVAAYAVKQYMAPKPQAQERGVPVVVAKYNLPVNTRLTPEVIEIKKMDKAPEGSFDSENKVLQRVNIGVVHAGQPIITSNLFPVGYTPTLEERLPPGHTAVTFPVEPNNALAGIVIPDAIVDVVLTVEVDKRERPELYGLTTTTILKKVKVVAVSEGRATNGLFKGTEGVNPNLRSITIAATPEQANKVILAQRYGTLSVTLRSPDDDTLPNVPSEKNTVNPLTLLGIAPPPPPQPKPPERVRKIEAWRGAQMRQIQFKEENIQGEKVLMNPPNPAEEPAAPARAVTAGFHPSPTDEKDKTTADRGE